MKILKLLLIFIFFICSINNINAFDMEFNTDNLYPVDRVVNTIYTNDNGNPIFLNIGIDETGSGTDTYDYQLLWDGEMRLTLDVFRDLGAAFIIALILIYLLMVAYYGEFTLPILVIAPTALTMIGIFPGHWITGQPFTATSMIGMIALAGIVVRNSTLLIDFIIDYRQQGYSVKESVLEAGAARTRPILLTALAVVAGTSIMISDPVFGGLGVSMAFGTIAATILTLFVTPIIYYLWQREPDK